ncbi:MAG: PhoH family protein [Bacteroidales bacterium]|nr:PhoH family protein [Bacteroidales bacterium]
MKKTITIGSAHPLEIYGAGNRTFEALCRYFPALKAVARGNEIHLEGSETDIDSFEKIVNALLEKHRRGKTPNVYDVENVYIDVKLSSEQNWEEDVEDTHEEITIVHSTEGKPINARNRNQEKMVKAYFENDLIFAVGPAGTGKTYIAIALAVRALKNREIKRIILTRPAVEAGERLGFLPGDLKDKLDPYLQPLYDALGDMIPTKKLHEFMADGTIQIAPLAYMRGRTLDRACVILDEAQNTNMDQLKMFLTRMGRDAKFIVTGDATQVDLPRKEESGLLKVIEMTKNIRGIATIIFKNEDIVRHPLVVKIVKAFDGLKEH